eukprot:m.14719 g.14719  ORF g.14719 m.14719 type:complete len:153 (+) comp3187_c0_seq1:123-581(+)
MHTQTRAATIRTMALTQRRRMHVGLQDTLSKIVAVWWPVFAFTAIGFEHSIANMFYVDIGLFEGADKTFGAFLLNNLVPVTLGNFVGGAVFLGLVQWTTFDDKATTVQNGGYTGEGTHGDDVALLEAGTRSSASERLEPIGSINAGQGRVKR